MTTVGSTYEIRVSGRISDAALASLHGMEAHVAATETALHGPIADQAELHGLLAQIQALGLELIEVRRIRS